MNISSVIVIPHPDRSEDVRRALEEIGGVEVHAVSPQGKMIVTLETENDGETIAAFERIGQLDGVLSASMVYHQHEPAPDMEISLEA
ncbi:MAG: chaperone NapD [Rhodocyclaceae bacterium]|nr:chaperone NapD [Rhodocyclaceae bacterium]